MLKADTLPSPWHAGARFKVALADCPPAGSSSGQNVDMVRVLGEGGTWTQLARRRKLNMTGVAWGHPDTKINETLAQIYCVYNGENSPLRKIGSGDQKMGTFRL